MKIKKILVVTTKQPFSKGGDSVLTDTLVNQLSKNFEVEKIILPFSTDYRLIEQQIHAIRNLKFNYGDLAITLRPCSYAIKHPNKVVWFMHHIREFYDLWDTELNPLKDKKNEIQQLREKIIKYDQTFLKECQKVFAISENVKTRLKKYNGIEAEVLYPPVDSKENYFCEEYSDYYYFPSRFAYNKRQHLVIEALKYAKGNFKVIMTGQIEEKYFRNYIKPLLNDPQINQRLEIMEYVDETIKRKLYARAIAVIFTPFDEDYGYVTLEAFYSSKSVITVNNSGACLEFVQNNKTGIVCKPSPESIAKAMDFLYENKSIAIQMGKNAKQFIEGKNISWEHTIQRIINYNPIQKIINSIFSWFPNK